ncbi:hypothetical protein INT47_004031 [Mucor saturninus]|uniref:Ndc10 domain-containing protein n=1 Tax=Mucor saturninus TaxID=64648 RepID=A0A8H7UQ03_9FUNG|nr:hypothetical protein INT47_004031 [Mucor saturninus]
MNGAYLTGLPRGIMRSLAGFPQQGTFFLPRNTTIPSENLQTKLFPEASMWLSKIHEGHAEQTVSAEGFLKLLLTIRITFLQDSVFVQQKFPTHPIWKHDLFQDEEYLSFKRQLLASSQAEENQESIMLQRVIPLVERKLANIEDSTRSAYEALAQQIASVLEKISDISTGSAPLQINIEWPQGESNCQPLIRTTAVTMPNTTQQNTTESSNVPADPSVSRPPSSTFRLKFMNTNHPGWYSSQKSFYMRRRKIIKACEEYAASEGWSVEDAVRRAEALRIRNKKSLDYISKNTDLIFSML